MEKERVFAIQVTAQFREMAKEIASLRAQVGKSHAEKRQQQESEEDEEKEREVNKHLKEQEKDLDSQELGKVIFLGDFYTKYFGLSESNLIWSKRKISKWGESVRFLDRNRENKHKFGDFGFTTKGLFVVADRDKNIIGKFPLPQGLFYKYSSLVNDFIDKRIVLGTDKDGNYAPEIDDIEIPVPVFNDETQEYEISEQLRANARDLIIQKDTENRLQSQKIEQLEIIVTDQKETIKNLKLTKNLYEKKADNAKSDLSMALDKVIEVQKKDYKKSGRIVHLSESGSMKEERIESIENVNKELLDKVENHEGKTKKELAKAEFKDAVDFVEKIPGKIPAK